MYVEMGSVKLDNIHPGDKIGLNSTHGPEGTRNYGIVKERKATGVLVDFGLTYAYVIPTKNIKKHYKLVPMGKETTNKPKKNNEFKI